MDYDELDEQYWPDGDERDADWHWAVEEEEGP